MGRLGPGPTFFFAALFAWARAGRLYDAAMTSRSWKFVRAGGFDQVQLSSGADLVSLDQLDQKLWVALACPVKGLEFDTRTLELIDLDKDGRIRAPELVAASKWVGSLLKNHEELMKGSDTLALSNINDGNEEGRLLVSTAKTLLKSLGKADAGAFSVDDATKAQKAFEGQPFNGDGVVPVDSAGDDATRAILADIIATQGSAPDKSGKPGVTTAQVEAFEKDLVAHAAWLGGETAAAQVLKGDTAAAYAAFSAVKAKIDDYFARCRMAAFDPRALTALNREEKDYLAVAAKDFSITAQEVAPFPLAQVAAGKALPLSGQVNPGWAEPLAAFVAKVTGPLAAKDPLTEAEWGRVRAAFAPYEAWQAAKAGAAVEKLGAARVKALASLEWKAKVLSLIAEDSAQKPVAEAITSVEKLVRLNRDLLKLANNFVSFRDFYSRKTPATFQVGTLFLDTRACELCIRVDDAGRHATMAPLSRSYLVYCDVARPASNEKMTIVAAMTAGDIDNLMVGRNGIFYDRQGRDWDATVTKIIDAPISVKQAFWSPYKKLIRFVEEQTAKRAAAADAAGTDRLVGSAAVVDKSVDGHPVDAAAPKKLDVGVVAAIGVAVGGITAAFGALLQAFFGLGFWMPLGLVGLVLAISGPSMAIAWLKLRQRNIGPLLDANGWAVNSLARINVPFGGSLTKEAALPAGSSRDLSDPFAEKPKPWGFWLVVAVLLGLGLAWYVGALDTLLPGPAKSTTVLGAAAPAYKAPAPENPVVKVPRIG